jgi:hypothetical protein
MLAFTASSALETAPVRPDGRADALFCEEVADLVSLDAVMERPDLVPELVGDVDHLRHLVGAVAVIVYQDVAAQHFGERLVGEIAGRRIALVIGVPLVPFAAVVHRSDPGGPITGDVAHASRRSAALSINPLGVFAARHLQSVLRAWKLHSLDGTSRHDFQHYAPATDQVG